MGYSITFGTKKEKIEDLFGTKNYEVVSYNSDYHYYHPATGDQVKFHLDKKNGKVYKITIGLYK